MTKIIFTLCISMTTLLTVSHAQSIIYVDQDSPALNPDGQSWGTAFVRLQDALDLAQQTPSGIPEIWVAEGFYQPTKAHPPLSMDPRDFTFFIGQDLQMYGGFNGTETSLAARNYATNETILNGNIGLPNDQTDNAYHVIKMQALAANGNISRSCIIDGFIIEDGYADGNFPDQIGGGIVNLALNMNNSSSPTIRNCIIRDNYASVEGGGIYNIGDNINAAMINCSFYNNSCIGDGSAIRNTGSSADTLSSFLISNCTFYNNVGENTILNQSVFNGIIENSIFWDNVNSLEEIGHFEMSNSLVSSLINSGTCPSNMTCANNIYDTDPLFVDPMNGNLQLQSSSPAIDQGNNAAIGLLGITRDLQHQPRLSSPCPNLMVDMGAYERQFTAPSAGYTMANALSGVQSMTRNYITDHSIESDQTIASGMANAISVTYQAGSSNPNNCIELLPNFEVVNDQMFHAFFSIGCP